MKNPGKYYTKYVQVNIILLYDACYSMNKSKIIIKK